MHIIETQCETVCPFDEPIMCDSNGDWRLGRLRLAIREGTVHVLLLFVLGLFLYLIKSNDRARISPERWVEIQTMPFS